MGRPKHLLPWRRTTLAEHLVGLLEPHVDAVAFLGAGHLPPSLSDRLRIEDDPTVSGPLSGILSALRTEPHAQEGAWLIVGCDLPLVTSSAIQWLVAQRCADARMIIPRDSLGFPQPHFSVFENHALASVQRAVDGGLRSPSKLVNHPETLSPSLPSWVESELINVNSPDDLLALKEAL